MDRLRRVAPWLLAAFLLCLFVLLLVWQVLGWLEMTGARNDANTAAPPPATTAPDLERLNILFGNPPRGEAPAASESATSIVLHGSLLNVDPARSSAVLQVGDQPARRYRVGDELARGIVLQRIDANRVQIRRNGRLETLAFPRPGAEGVTVPEPSPEPLPEPPPADEEPPAVPTTEPAAAPQTPSEPPPGVFDPPPEAVPDVPGARAP